MHAADHCLLPLVACVLPPSPKLYFAPIAKLRVVHAERPGAPPRDIQMSGYGRTRLCRDEILTQTMRQCGEIPRTGRLVNDMQ
jgi:hypothetical protein